MPSFGCVGWWVGRGFHADYFTSPVCAACRGFECVGPDERDAAGCFGKLGDGAGADGGVEFGKEGCCDVVLPFGKLFSLCSEFLNSRLCYSGRVFLGWLWAGGFFLRACDRTCVSLPTAACILQIHATHRLGDIVTPLLLFWRNKLLRRRVLIIPVIDNFGVPERIKARS